MRFLYSVHILLVFCSLCAPAAQAALPPPRPLAGIGVLAVVPGPGAQESGIVLYQEPGVARIAEVAPGELPRLSGDAAQPLLVVHERRGAWFRIVYDDAVRKAWIAERRSWHYFPWPDYLPGRRVTILPGMKKANYLLRSEPNEASREVGTLEREQAVRVLEVKGDWLRLQAPAGWFRWRDGDERLTIGVGGEFTEKR